ncbi:MAG: carboxypeptidase regulatory-like domain-containing protein [Acidobacteria bacterium]|nr:carboxypeptidase regulatory-like domain-containing protein [Acidobacteriota bacterium]
MLREHLESPNVSDITDAGGLYSMSGFGPDAYVITASKTAYPVGTSSVATGIFADDATAIVRHVVGLEVLTNPTQLAAAKVSGVVTPALSSFDAALISQWIVAIPSPINQTGQWKLSPTSQPSTVTANATQNYTALLMGDVNQSWNNDPLSRPALTEPTERSVLPSITSMEAEKGREVIVPFRIDNLGGKSVGSYQFDIEFDPTVIEPVTTAADVMGTQSEGLTVISNSPEAGLLKVAAYGALPASGDGVYVNLKFRTLGAVGSTTQVTIKEFMFNNGSDEVFAKGGRVSVTRESNDTGIKGRVISAFGQPVANAKVILTATDGTTRTTVTGSLGSYEFGGLVTGETYTVTVQAKRFTFEPRKRKRNRHDR